MEQNLLLTAERLKLSANLQRGWASRGAFVIKNVPAQVYFTVSREQAQVLDCFSDGATVPEVLDRLLRERRCPPLREYYELVLKAYTAGVLCTGPMRQPPRGALTWHGWAAGTGWCWLLAGAQVAAAILLAWKAPSFAGQAEIGGWLPGLALVSVALTLGQMLGASILTGLGGDIYARRLFDSLRVLHWRLDLRDALMLRPAEQALIGLATQFPLAVALLCALTLYPVMAVPLLVAWMLVWRPWGDSQWRRLTAMMSNRPALDTDTGFIFEPNQRTQLHWRPWWRRWDCRICALEFIWAALWSVLVVRLLLALSGVDFREALATDGKDYWMFALPGVGAALLVVVLVFLGRRWRYALRAKIGEWRAWWELYQTRQRDYIFPETDALMMRMANNHPLFPLLAMLNPYDRTALVKELKPVTYGARCDISSAGGAQVGMILSGCIHARRTLTSGRKVRALTLEEGDFFGLPAPLAFGGEAVALELRSASPIAALSVPAEVFQRHVIDKLGGLLVYDYTYKLSFLRRVKVCAHWDAAVVARFSRLAQVAAYKDGDVIVSEGQETHWFYILYDGVAQVRRKGKLAARLKVGDFFGEISLLQNSQAVADVVAQGQVRCLQIDRISFLRFVTYNHHVALTLERISSKRLGHPIFPLKAAAVGQVQSSSNSGKF